MHACLDDLVTALYVTIDELVGPRLGPGRPPKLSDAELVCLAVAQVLLGARSERHWLRFAHDRLGHLFPYLPGQAGYNKRLRAAAHLVVLALADLAVRSPSWCDGFRLLDATPLPCGASRETVKRSALWGQAAYGYDRSHSRWYWGFKLYLLCAPDGMPIAWCLATLALASARSPRRCWTMPPASRRWPRARSSWPTRALPAARSTSTSASWGHGWSARTARTNHLGSGRLAACASGSRAPSTPSRTNSGWNATVVAPWAGSLSALPSGCSPGRSHLVQLATRGPRQALPGGL